MSPESDCPVFNFGNPGNSTARLEITRASKKIQAFLCHAVSDKERVRKLYRELQRDGIEPWFDEESLFPGQDWELEIRRAIARSDAVIVCLSKGSSTKTGYVQKEIKLALDHADKRPEGAIFLVPAKLEECDIPERLARWQYVDLFLDNGYKKLLHSVQSSRKGSAV